MRFCCFLATFFAFFTLQHAFSQEKPKWNVAQPALGAPLKDVSFTTDEGTWMSVDVSPDGKTLVFDLLGDIYSMPVTGGPANCLRNGLPWEVQPRFSPDGKQILFTSDAGGGDNIWVMQADGSKARQITKESFRLLNNAVWMPDGQYIIARKHFTSGRSLGAGELWMYHTNGGDGAQLTKRKNDQQDVNEPSVSPDGRYVYYSEDLYPGGFFQYNKDPNDQIFAVRRYDLQEGKTEDITGGSGGACRPQISRDGKWLAFVRRVRTKTALFAQNLETGEEYFLYDGLDKDQQEAWTIFGCYPGFAWMPGDKQIVLWAGGKIKMLDLQLPPNAQKTGVTATVVPFTVNVNTKVGETLRFENKAYEAEFTAKAIRQAVTSPDGRILVFNAGGYLYRKNLPDGNSTPFAGNAEALAFEPVFAPNGKTLAYVTWNDETQGQLAIAQIDQSGNPRFLNTGKGTFRTPAFSADGKWLVYRKQGGDDETGFVNSKKTGIYLIDVEGKSAPRFVTEEGENPRFSPDGQRIFVNTGGYLFGALDKALVSFDLNGKDRRVHFKSKYVNQWAPSPDGKWLAFTELHKAYVCAFPSTGQPIDLSADTKAIPLAQVARDAGYNLHWSGDSKTLHWTLGDTYFTNNLNKRFAFLEGAPDTLPPMDSTGLRIGLKLPYDTPEGTIVFENARILTMVNERPIENGVLEVNRNLITFVGTKAEYKAYQYRTPKTATPAPRKTIDCSGKTIMPGLIDVHAHSGNFRSGLNPQKQWEYYANLAYGVTTMHDPSVNSEMAFSNAEMLKSGRMVGPRLFSTGTIIYGADGDFKAPINSLDDARAALRRTKAWGAISVKSYNQPRREQRQQVIAAARELGMLVVPEGGSFFHHNLTEVVDGHTGIEHNIPVTPLYSDVTKLWSNTKAHNTPTLIVNYGGLNGENYWYQNTDVWKKERLLRFTPRHIIDGRARHVAKAPDEEYQNGHLLTSKSCTKLQNAGININLGAHGQLQGLGAHWELWMLAQGGMSNQQALQCATINGARYLGMDKQIGSLSSGKLADLLVLDANPLQDIKNTESIRYVMVNGRLYDAETLDEIGNHPHKRGKFWFELPGSQINGSLDGQHSCTETKCVCGH